MLSGDTSVRPATYDDAVLRSLWDETRPTPPPPQRWRDWALVGAFVLVALLEGVFPYSLLRWGSGRDMVLGSAVVLAKIGFWLLAGFADAGPSVSVQPIDPLTAREEQVLAAVAAGGPIPRSPTSCTSR